MRKLKLIAVCLVLVLAAPLHAQSVCDGMYDDLKEQARQDWQECYVRAGNAGDFYAVMGCSGIYTMQMGIAWKAWTYCKVGEAAKEGE